MNCILCFLEDQFQEEIRVLSQSKSERFEDVMTEFQNNFLNSLHFLNSIDECYKHNHLHEKTKDVAKTVQEKIISLSDIKEYFNQIRSIYLTWIKGNGTTSVFQLKKLLEEKQLLITSDKINNHIFYRGRKSSNILTKEDIFHLPFNKRYLIQNQRYSITGQPLLYLGMCPLDVVFELREDIEKIENIYFCSYTHSTEAPLKIFDITNEFPEYFSNLEAFHKAEIELPNPIRYAERDFYKFILAQFCSFTRSKSSEKSAFCEEYVISQMLTEVLRNIGYNGILFSSTRVDMKRIFTTSTMHVNRYRENVALFTNYQENRNYDADLFNSFIISKPTTIDELIELTLEDLQIVQKQIGKMTQEQRGLHPPFPLNVAEIMGIGTTVRFEDLVISDGKTRTNYFDHKIGKLHLHLVYQTCLHLRNKMKNWT